jgi:hypothetical protein
MKRKHKVKRSSSEPQKEEQTQQSTSMLEPRSEEKAKALAECEQAIQANSKMFAQAGEALTKISAESLYKPEFTSFDKYCEGRWGFSGSHARRLIDGYKLVKKLRSAVPKFGDDELPQNEFQARLYMDHRDEKHWLASWRKLLKTSKEKGLPISASLIRDVCGKSAENDTKNPHPKAKAKVMEIDEPRLEYVNTALSRIEDAKVHAEDYSLKDWNTFLDEIESLLEHVG